MNAVFVLHITSVHVMTTYLNDEKLLLDLICVDSQAAACVLIVIMAHSGKSLNVCFCYNMIYNSAGVCVCTRLHFSNILQIKH